MATRKQTRVSNLYWEWLKGEPKPTKEEAGEAAFALVDPNAEVRDTLAHAVQIMRGDTARLNAALDETEEEREARLERQREYTRRWREKAGGGENGETCENGEEREKSHKTSQVSQVSQVSRDLTNLTPTNTPTNTLTHNLDSCRDKPDQKPERFRKPTVEEVAAYVREKGYSFDAQAFWDFYESKSWMIGKNKMTKWKSACATWERTERGRRQQPGHAGYIAPTDEEVRQYGGLV